MVDLTNPVEKIPEGKLLGAYDELPLWSAPFGLELLKHIKLK